MTECINIFIDEESVGDEELVSLLHEGYCPNEMTLLIYLSRNLRIAPQYRPVNPQVVRALLSCGASPYLINCSSCTNECSDVNLLPPGLRSTFNLAVLSGNLEIIEALLIAGDRLNRFTLRYAGSIKVFQLLFAKGAKATFEDCLLHQSILESSSALIIE